MGAHALLSPSSAHRWMHCAAAPRLEALMEDKGSEYAAEGSLAHAMAAKQLKQWLDLPTSAEDEEIENLLAYHSPEMAEYVGEYVDTVLSAYAEAKAVTPDARLLVEQRLDFSEYVPEAFGTSDAIIIADGTMEVFDLKYGKGVQVSAVGNPQMRIYALGAYEEFSPMYRIDAVRMTIVQPRLGNTSSEEVTAAALTAWAEEVLIPAARKAYRGDGPQTPGRWCQFCKCKAQCSALSTMCADTASSYADHRLLSSAELAEKVLPLLPVIRTWLSGVEEAALQRALSGESLPGYKVVEGRSIRRITDTDLALSRLVELGYERDALMRPPELRSLTDLERLVGKKRLSEALTDCIERPQGKPTLVTVDDKRPEFSSALADFKGVNI